MKNSGISVCLIYLFLIQGVPCLVELEISVVQFDNPLGTSYTGRNDQSARKCCDTGGSNCQTTSDKCDVYFTFCIGSLSNDPTNAGCNGTSIDMQNDVSRDVLKITGNRKLKRFVRVTSWKKGITGLIVNVFDIDELPSQSTNPHIFPDLIDTFNRVVQFDPAPNFWAAKDQIVSMVGHVSLDLRLRAWCATGWYGKSCENQCRVDDFHECTSDGVIIPHQECTDPDTLVFSVKESISAVQSSTSLQIAISGILANYVCLKTTDNIRVNIHEIRENRNGHVDIVFNGYCDDRPVSSLKFREMVYVMNTVITRLPPLDNYFAAPIISPSFRFVQDNQIDIIILVRMVNFRDVISGGCSGGTDIRCNPKFKIYVSSATVFATIAMPKSQNLTDCDGAFVDLSRNQTSVYTSNSTLLFGLKSTEISQIHVDVRSAKTNALIALHTFSMSQVVIGRNFLDSYPHRFQTSTEGDTTLTLEVMAWCGNCRQGDRCQTVVPGCSAAVTVIQPDCRSDNECKNGGKCALHETCVCKPGLTGPICNTDIDECALGLCVHADTCMNARGGYSCTCSKGFTGQECDTDIDECLYQPCKPGLACLNAYGTYHCIDDCASNSMVNVNCTRNVDFCTSGPCLHNGTCSNMAFNFTCNCNGGWTGSTCQTNVNECTNTGICQNGGICNDTPGSFNCTCSKTFTGRYCEDDVDECLDHTTCKNNGTCINNEEGFSCSCPASFSGDTCDQDVDECSNFNVCMNGICTNTIGGYKCQCLSGWDGVSCDVDIDECLDPGTCKNNATCVNQDGGYFCHCLNGFTGNNCDFVIDESTNSPCVNGEYHNAFGTHKCICFYGWDGDNCDIDRDECMSQHACINGGTCVNNPGSFNCNCTEHWSGGHCQTDVNECAERYACNFNGNCTNTNGGFTCSCFHGWMGNTCNDDVDECLNPVCKNGATCVNNDGGFTCKCPANWNGKTCENDVNECSMYSPCQNGGTCSNIRGSYKCACPKGWTGINCTDDFDECLLASPCLNGGSCNNADGSYTCLCPSEWTGSKCETDLNECLLMPCANNGSCTNFVNGYSCACTAAWTGRKCTVNIDECSTYRGICKHGVCKDSVGSYYCDCVGGYQGQNCSQDINECGETGLCKNGGTCINTIGNYMCLCPQGWSGINCTNDFNECQNQNPCHNGGTCININGNFRCTCETGWTGKSCEQDIDECSTSPCFNDGSCFNTPGNFHCDCKQGWEGETCQSNKNDCLAVQCQNGAKCQDLVKGYTCICRNGYTGKLCDVNIDDCASSPCQNGGNCHDHVGYFECVCPKGWDGQMCTTDVDECRDHPCGRGQACRNNQGSFACIVEHFGPLSTSPTTTHDQGPNVVVRLEDAIHPGCTSSGWNITLDMSILRHLYPKIKANQIYFGDNTCRGTLIGYHLVFIQGFRDCLTAERISGDAILYENELFYAIYDPIHPFIIRHHNWTYGVECDVQRNEATSSHVHHNVETHHFSVSVHYNVNMTFFKDPGYMNQLPGNPIKTNVGDDVYIKVFTTATDWNIKMRLHTCYTKPTEAVVNMTYYIIKDGCEVDSNTHIISQSTHETRFVFQDFEYSTNREGLNIYCNATFCEAKDYSPGCAQSCISPGTKALTGK